MRLWIVRHGKADQRSPSGMDRDRPLMERGRTQAIWLGEKIATKKRRPEVILTSGVERAITTARLIQESLNCALEVVKELETGHSVSEAVDVIAARNEEGVMVVGHNPTFGELVWILENGLPERESLMRTGEAAVLDFEGGFAVGKGTLHRRMRVDEED